MVSCNSRGSLGFLLGLTSSSSDLTLLLLVDPVPALELQKKNHKGFSQLSEISSSQLSIFPTKKLVIIIEKSKLIDQKFTTTEFRQIEVF
jgi:hypothetical protein